MLHFFDNFSQERMIPEESVGLYSERNPVPVAQLNLRTVQTDTCAQRKGSPEAIDRTKLTFQWQWRLMLMATRKLRSAGDRTGAPTQ